MGEIRSEVMQKATDIQEESYKSGLVQYIDSREVAEIVEKKHCNLVRDIKRYSTDLTKLNFEFSDFFIESSYNVEGQSRKYPCYLVTRKGCEFIAHKLTGQKGTEFTARYINRFHEMEEELTIINPSEISLGELASYLKIMDKIAVQQNLAPHKIAENFKKVSAQFGVELTEDFVKVPEYEQLTLDCMRN